MLWPGCPLARIPLLARVLGNQAEPLPNAADRLKPVVLAALPAVFSFARVQRLPPAPTIRPRLAIGIRRLVCSCLRFSTAWALQPQRSAGPLTEPGPSASAHARRPLAAHAWRWSTSSWPTNRPGNFAGANVPIPLMICVSCGDRPASRRRPLRGNAVGARFRPVRPAPTPNGEITHYLRDHGPLANQGAALLARPLRQRAEAAAGRTTARCDIASGLGINGERWREIQECLLPILCCAQRIAEGLALDL